MRSFIIGLCYHEALKPNDREEVMPCLALSGGKHMLFYGLLSPMTSTSGFRISKLTVTPRGVSLYNSNSVDIVRHAGEIYDTQLEDPEI